jgi:hypothetical protein
MLVRKKAAGRQLQAASCKPQAIHPCAATRTLFLLSISFFCLCLSFINYINLINSVNFFLPRQLVNLYLPFSFLILHFSFFISSPSTFYILHSILNILQEANSRRPTDPAGYVVAPKIIGMITFMGHQEFISFHWSQLIGIIHGKRRAAKDGQVVR